MTDQVRLSRLPSAKENMDEWLCQSLLKLRAKQARKHCFIYIAYL
jgi:hypothetical protein